MDKKSKIYNYTEYTDDNTDVIIHLTGKLYYSELLQLKKEILDMLFDNLNMAEINAAFKYGSCKKIL